MHSDSYGVSSPKDNAWKSIHISHTHTYTRARSEKEHWRKKKYSQAMTMTMTMRKKEQCTANCNFKDDKSSDSLTEHTIRARDKGKSCNTVTFYVCLITCTLPPGEKGNLMSILIWQQQCHHQHTHNNFQLCLQPFAENECSQLISEHFLCDIRTKCFL